MQLQQRHQCNNSNTRHQRRQISSITLYYCFPASVSQTGLHKPARINATQHVNILDAAAFIAIQTFY